MKRADTGVKKMIFLDSVDAQPSITYWERPRSDKSGGVGACTKGTDKGSCARTAIVVDALSASGDSGRGGGRGGHGGGSGGGGAEKLFLPPLWVPAPLERRLMQHQRLGVRWLHGLHLRAEGGGGQ
ncbi:hypothetical protein B484DRAFT_424538, partial [Ochromonadaceae sp. CCMP2298]